MASLPVRRYREDRNRSRYEEIHNQLLNAAFDLYVTTNYDCCLERAAETPRCPLGSVTSYPALPSPLNARPRSLFHIHGRIEGTETPDHVDVVLSESDYRKAYRKRTDVSDFLKELLICGRTVVFCGFGFRDHDLFFRCLEEGRQKFRQVAEQQRDAPALCTHYAFVQVEGVLNNEGLATDPSVREKRKRQFGSRLPDLRPAAEIVPILYGDAYPDDPGRAHLFLTRLSAELAKRCPYRHGPAVARRAEGTTYR